jgi:hypothetical protein
MENHEILCPDAASVVDHLQKYPSAMNFAEELKARSKAADEGKGDEKKGKMDAEICDEDREDAEFEAIGVVREVNGEVVEEESWDAEVEDNLKKGVVTYNPKIHLAKNQGKIIQQLGGITTKSERKAFRESQSAAFEARGGDFHDDKPNRDRNGWTGPGPSREPERMTESEIRLKRARELAMAQKNASLVVGHLDPQNRKRRSDQAVQQINNIISLAQSEQQSEQSQLSDTASTISSVFSSSTL